MLTHHGGIETRYLIAGFTLELIKLALANMDDPSVTEPCAIIVSHTVTAVLCPGEDRPMDQKALKSVGPLLPIFNFFDALIRNLRTTYKAYNHIFHFLTDASQNARETFLAHPSSISLLVAALRSADIQTRTSALGGIMRLHYAVAYRGRVQWDPQVVVRNYTKRGHNTPDSAGGALVAYGMHRTDIVLMMTSTANFQKAMMKFAQDKDYYALGMTLFDLIGKTEFSIADGYFADENGKPIPTGLPFVSWLDALPHCAKAIREKGGSSKHDIANVIDLKYYILRSRYQEARELAEQALKTSPTVAFYYYAMTIASSSKEEALRWAKKGLKGKGLTMTPYVRFGLMFNAITNAGLLGIEYLLGAEMGQKQFEEAYTFLKVALEDAK
ncbi:hypothetical protein M422DRAFT_255706, partial [Sphaerobolus stellatus SS14]